MLPTLKLCSGRGSGSGPWGYRGGLGSAAWDGKSQHHSGPKETILVSVKETHGDTLLGGATAPKSSGTWALRPSLTCVLTVQDGCLSSCHRLLSPGSRAQKERRVRPPVRGDLSSAPHPAARRRTQLPGRPAEATVRPAATGPTYVRVLRPQGEGRAQTEKQPADPAPRPRT